ncbi:hypothetical protein IEQ34_007529 [Dendrobium chrysotoxum]|uniref:Uncharacterized protein n=1 Tax=Dendrobium chrysotoxum TaxID=161865 RepID=A0AAV7H4Y3_DENCH|nr:hypothetical protein IEQ34_007529 [Dendrobium chrysotoxum]
MEKTQGPTHSPTCLSRGFIEARDHIYDVEVKTLELECMEEGFIRDSDSDEVESELQKAFSLENEDDLKIL